MNILKKEYWVLCLVLDILTGGYITFAVGYSIGVYDKNAWYTKKEYWIGAALCLFFPIFIMFTVFHIQTLVNVCKKLHVPGKEIYATPYSWILCLIVPVLGCILLCVMLIYLNVWMIVELAHGEGEKYIAN